ncbi:hypothetical protein ICW40_07465 [Actinotalea ferrariae]|uniref:hypothetical protein n=1 Tax=Actinotalea ferrariae TaxID=1386098 RepID=UPI001C8C722C|nr:hypothetical protein [Actinotalea ferrariae]MBX9244647.1 hypothetical protein [Actinotalea ferrariae]
MTPRPIDCLRIVWWAQLGYLHGARRGRLAGRLASGFLALMWWPTLPLLVIAQALLLARPRARYYMSPQRDAVIAVVASSDAWEIGEHLSAHPGHGRGRALRELMTAPVLAAADTTGIDVRANAATAELARRYITDIPGLVDVGRAFPRGRRLLRGARPDPAAPGDRPLSRPEDAGGGIPTAST